jgi:putative ABC transport system ATP-binding protein
MVNRVNTPTNPDPIRADPMIQFDSVHLKLNNRQIFSGLNFRVREKEKVLIQGKSGVGKTTLFKILLGFEPIDSGTVRFNGLDIVRENIRTIRSQIFYLSQDIDLKNEPVKLLLDEIGRFNAFKNPDKSHLMDLLDFLDLNEKILDQEVKELSGGERQRIGLLICLLLDRPVWLLDEPTSALDDAMKKKTAEYIRARDKTIVIISHDDVWKKTHGLRPDLRIERWD